jgi:hypothetical protein
MAEQVPTSQNSSADEAATESSLTTSPVPAAPEDGRSESAPTIGKIERVPLREVWKHEAYNLTTWLEENIDVLTDALDIDLSNVERERAAGSFSVDLVAEDDSGGTVVIENQLEKSNHDHLGKLITYVSFIDARAAIWIVSDPRPEHVRAISWLNESSPADFYILKIEGVRIGDSMPAPLLTLIVGPSEETRSVGEAKKERAERYDIRHRFWSRLLDRAKERTRLHAAISPGSYSWVGAGSGKRGLGFNYSVTQHGAAAELYIDRGRDGEQENSEIFNALHACKEDVEQVFGGPLDWQPLEAKRACRIMYRIDAGGYRDEERWPEIQDAMVDAMVRLEKALKPHIAKLSI